MRRFFSEMVGLLGRYWLRQMQPVDLDELTADDFVAVPVTEAAKLRHLAVLSSNTTQLRCSGSPAVHRCRVRDRLRKRGLAFHAPNASRAPGPDFLLPAS